MEYRYKGFDFSTECELYKIIAAEIDTPYIKECRGVCTIYFPKSLGGTSRIVSSFQDIRFTYSKTVYRLKSIDPISLTIVEITDLNDTLIDYDDYHVNILSTKITDELITRTLLESGLFVISKESRSLKFEYKEVMNLLINKTYDLNEFAVNKNPINLIDTKDRYILDFTHSMFALYEVLDKELAKFGFYLKNLNKTEETSTREVATLQFDNYPEDYFRLYPSVSNEMTSYKVPCKLILNTSSVTKFERLLSEYNSIKFLSNVVRVYLEDKLRRIWTANIRWNQDVTTNPTTKAENDRSESSYYIEIDLEYEFCVVRNNTYAPIKRILLNHAKNEQHKIR